MPVGSEDTPAGLDWLAATRPAAASQRARRRCLLSADWRAARVGDPASGVRRLGLGALGAGPLSARPPALPERAASKYSGYGMVCLGPLVPTRGCRLPRPLATRPTRGVVGAGRRPSFLPPARPLGSRRRTSPLGLFRPARPSHSSARVGSAWRQCATGAQKNPPAQSQTTRVGWRCALCRALCRHVVRCCDGLGR